MSKTYRVDGMTCGGCAQSVTKAIQAVADNVKVEVNLEEKTITVEGLDDDSEVARAVKEAGFDFGGPC
jgi:copper chaperone